MRWLDKDCVWCCATSTWVGLGWSVPPRTTFPLNHTIMAASSSGPNLKWEGQVCDTAVSVSKAALSKTPTSTLALFVSRSLVRFNLSPSSFNTFSSRSFTSEFSLFLRIAPNAGASRSGGRTHRAQGVCTRGSANKTLPTKATRIWRGPNDWAHGGACEDVRSFELAPRRSDLCSSVLVHISAWTL